MAINIEQKTHELREEIRDTIELTNDELMDFPELELEEDEEDELRRALQSAVNETINEFRTNEQLSNTKMKLILKGTGLNVKTMELQASASALRRSLRKDPNLRAKLNDVKNMVVQPGHKNWLKVALVTIFRG